MDNARFHSLLNDLDGRPLSEALPRILRVAQEIPQRGAMRTAEADPEAVVNDGRRLGIDRKARYRAHDRRTEDRRSRGCLV